MMVLLVDVRAHEKTDPAPGATHPPQAVPPPFQGGFFGGLIGGCPGAWKIRPCAGGGLTHRKRSPLPFREGFFGSGAYLPSLKGKVARSAG